MMSDLIAKPVEDLLDTGAESGSSRGPPPPPPPPPPRFIPSVEKALISTPEKRASVAQKIGIGMFDAEQARKALKPVTGMRRAGPLPSESGGKSNGSPVSMGGAWKSGVESVDEQNSENIPSAGQRNFTRTPTYQSVSGKSGSVVQPLSTSGGMSAGIKRRGSDMEKDGQDRNVKKCLEIDWSPVSDAATGRVAGSREQKPPPARQRHGRGQRAPRPSVQDIADGGVRKKGDIYENRLL